MDKSITAEHRVMVGEPAPDFELETTEGGRWRLSDHRGKVAALLFYPKNETLVCTRQLCAVRDNWAKYLETKAAVVGISHGSVNDHLVFSRRHKLPLPLLADTDRDVTNTYNFHWIFPTFFTRAIVVVDAEGIIRSRSVMLRAFRPTDESVIASIYAARADSLSKEYRQMTRD